MSTSWTKIKSVSSAGAAKPGMSEEKKKEKKRKLENNSFGPKSSEKGKKKNTNPIKSR